MDRRLTLYILIGMLLGVATGYIVHVTISVTDPSMDLWLKGFGLLSTVFMNLIKMLVAPLVLATIISGIAHMNDTAAIGRISIRALSWFIIVSFISIGLGLVMVNLFKPGAGLSLVHSMESAADVKTLDVFVFIAHIFPENIVSAMADNNVLQILVFAVLAGIGLTAIAPRGEPLVHAAEALAELMLRMTGYVMRLAPLAVFGALAQIVAKHGLSVLYTYVTLLAEFYLSLLILWAVLIGIGWLFLRQRILMLVRYVKEPVLLAFSTASSEAAMPKLFEQLDRFGVPRRVSGLTIPLGYSFNLDGTMMYASFATIFIAQAYGIHLSISQQILILLTLMVSSKGIAAVPRASLVVITATLAMFGLPVEGVALVFAIDQFLDMGRTATNVLGNAVATSVITKWEGLLQVPIASDPEEPHAPSNTTEHGRHGLHMDPTQ